MKAGEYISLFGVISTNQPGWNNDPNVSVFDFLENNPEYELSEYELEKIYLSEIFSFKEFISYFNEEKEILSFLRETFDEYRTNGGDAEYWLCTLLNEIDINPHLFPTLYRGLIEKNLLQWLENWRNFLSEGQPPASHKIAKPPSLKSTKRELNELTTIAIALIHVFTKNPITTENRKDIAARYINPASGKPYSAIKLYTSYMNLPMERLRQKPTETLCNHYKRCINWLKSNGLKPAQRAAESELRQLKNKKG